MEYIMHVPFLDLSAQNAQIRTEIDSAIKSVLDANAFCLGPQVEDFERAWSDYCQVPFALGVNSATSALHLAALLLDIKPGDEVIVPAYTFAATAWLASYVRATPVFVDIEEDTFNIAPQLIESAITDKTKAIAITHLYGQSADMDPILAVANKHQLPVVEDAAQAHGALYKKEHVGSLGVFGAFSFYPTKNLSACGEGGALVMKDEALYRRAQALRVHGSYERYIHEEVGYNYRMEGIQGAILGVKLKYLDAWTERRRYLASIYNEGLKDTPLALPVEKEYARHVYHQYSVRHSERDQLMAHLQKHNIGCAIHYPMALHQQPCYKHLKGASMSFPVAEKAASEVLCLPIVPELKDEQIEIVIDCIYKFFK